MFFPRRTIPLCSYGFNPFPVVGSLSMEKSFPLCRLYRGKERHRAVFFFSPRLSPSLKAPFRCCQLPPTPSPLLDRSQILRPASLERRDEEGFFQSGKGVGPSLPFSFGIPRYCQSSPLPSLSGNDAGRGPLAVFLFSAFFEIGIHLLFSPFSSQNELWASLFSPRS